MMDIISSRLMMKLRYSFLLFFTLAFELSAAATLIKKGDIQPLMEEMFSYHVENRELSPLIFKRSMKSFIEQFDTQKGYLLQSEVTPFLEFSPERIERAIEAYDTSNFEEYELLSKTIAHAIHRAQEMRGEIIQDMVAGRIDITKLPKDTPHYQFAYDLAELKARMIARLGSILISESPTKQEAFWTPERKVKVFDLYEKKLIRFEKKYLSQEKKHEHYFSLHVLKSLARSLDSHSAFYSREEALEMKSSLQKQFEGLGVVLKEGVEGVEIADLVKGAPAFRSELIRKGDILTEIDGLPLLDVPYEEVLERLKGEGQKGTELGLKRFEKDGSTLFFKVNLEREKVLMEEGRLTYDLIPFKDGFIAKIVIPSFYESFGSSSCEMDLRSALREIKRKGKIEGIVLDLRENLGGFLNQAIKVTSLFITNGVVAVSKYAQGEVQYLRSIDPRLYYNGPMVVLTSKASASAAEIVAQSLQDYGVALVVGDERTYGKGTIQYQTVTDEEALNFFKVTVGRYYTVSGRSTQINGVEADIVVPSVFAPFNIGERYLEYSLPNDQITSLYKDQLVDVHETRKGWFEKNYVPYIQKKESKWQKMLVALKNKSASRMSKTLKNKSAVSSGPTGPLNESGVKCGKEDAQMTETLEILKDMVQLQPARPKFKLS